MRHHRGGNRGQDRGHGNNNDVLGVLYPAKRIVAKQNIAHRTASEGRRGSDDNDAKRIHTAAPGSQRAGHGFRRNPNQIKNMKQHKSPTVMAEG